MRDEASDEQLMQDYRDGDAGAFDVLYRRHKGGLYRYLFRLCREQSVAEEMFQEVWGNLIRSRERYQPSAKFTTFLYQIAHNRMVDHLRQKPELTVPLDAEGDEDDPPVLQLADDAAAQPEQMVERQRLVAELLAQIAALPLPQREAFLLREESDMSLEEIAEATGVTMETAKSRLRYAVAKLRDGLRGMR